MIFPQLGKMKRNFLEMWLFLDRKILSKKFVCGFSISNKEKNAELFFPLMGTMDLLPPPHTH